MLTKRWPMTAETFDGLIGRFIPRMVAVIDDPDEWVHSFSVAHHVCAMAARALEGRDLISASLLEFSTPESRIVESSISEGDYGLCKPLHGYLSDDELDERMTAILRKPMRELSDRELFDLMSVAHEAKGICANEFAKHGMVKLHKGRPVFWYSIPDHRHID